jgi:hypothetical protein
VGLRPIQEHAVEVLVCDVHVLSFVVVGRFPENPSVQASDVAREFFDRGQLIVKLREC